MESPGLSTRMREMMAGAQLYVIWKKQATKNINEANKANEEESFGRSVHILRTSAMLLIYLTTTVLA